jgi:phage terminase large subunit
MTAIVSRSVTPDSVMLRAVEQRLAARAQTAYPLMRWERDPVGYAFERLKVDVLMDHQIDILRAICAGVWREKPSRVAASSCQKAGKSATIILAAMWFYECFAGARVFMTAAIETQTKTVLWYELGKTLRAAKKAGVEIDGSLAKSPAGGLVSADGSREIKGITGREIEAKAGLSGRMLFIIDEASALPERMAQVFDGNAMGGGNLVFTSNPTQCSGPFFEAFNRRKDFWQTFQISAFDVIAWQERTGRIIEGTVTRERVAEAELIYGKDSPFYEIRVLGNFLRNETGRCIPMALIESALARWSELEEQGPLVIGLDPAGPGDKGDEFAWAMVRGPKLAPLHRRRGLTTDAACEETYSLLKIHRRDGEVPEVHLDSEGMIGSELLGKLRAESERRRLHDVANVFDVVSIRSSSKYVRDPTKFERVRDEMIWNCAEWMATAAGIPKDDKLQIEMYEFQWTSMPDGRLRATPKSEIRDKLGRSPDSFDAVCIAVTKRHVWQPDTTNDARGPNTRDDLYESELGRGRGLDPYSSGRGFRR